MIIFLGPEPKKRKSGNVTANLQGIRRKIGAQEKISNKALRILRPLTVSAADLNTTELVRDATRCDSLRDVIHTLVQEGEIPGEPEKIFLVVDGAGGTLTAQSHGRKAIVEGFRRLAAAGATGTADPRLRRVTLTGAAHAYLERRKMN